MFIPLLLSQTEEIETPDTLMPSISPPTGVMAKDVPNDEGRQLVIRWELSPDDEKLDAYIVYRAREGEEFIQVAVLAPGADSLLNNNDMLDRIVEYYTGELKLLKRRLRRAKRTNDEIAIQELEASITQAEGALDAAKSELLQNFTPYTYKVAAAYQGYEFTSKPSSSVEAAGHWFHFGRINVLVAMIVFFFLVAFFLTQAKRGKELFLRKIAGLEAIDDAVGRATEMGRPILFVPGLSSIQDIATIAALNILQGIAKKAAEYDTPIIVPNRDPIVYTVAREIVKEAYSDVGRPDAFNPDSVYFVTQNQFAYVAAVNGVMLREKPATNFFLGMFWAESLLLAETGNVSGAIQIAGTDASAQLPFFITACDYTIIGEELYAASAYISREPGLMGTIKAQDWSKVIITGLLIVLTILALIGVGFTTQILKTV
jgi:hypothetical protein